MLYIVNLKKPRARPKLINVRNYKNVNIVQLKKDLEQVPWNIIELFDDIDDILWCWQSLFKYEISQHVKTRKVKVRSNNLPWMTGEIRKALNDRYKLLLKARKTPRNSQEWLNYKRKRNQCTNLIRNTKVNYWKNQFSTSDSSKSFWKTVKMFNGCTKENLIGPLKNSTGKIMNKIMKSQKKI